MVVKEVANDSIKNMLPPITKSPLVNTTSESEEQVWNASTPNNTNKIKLKN